jgi:hypothetical protein
MSDWANKQTVAIARRVIAEPGAGSDRLLWAAMTLSAAEFVMGERLTEAEQAAVARAMRGKQETEIERAEMNQ